MDEFGDNLQKVGKGMEQGGCGMAGCGCLIMILLPLLIMLLL